MALLPMSPLWTLVHVVFKYPGILAAAGIVYLIIPEHRVPYVPNYAPAPVAQDLSDTPMIAITFDDGWQSVHSIALPELHARGMVATNYLTTGFLGKPRYIRPNDIRDFVDAGWEIGGHSVDHSDLASLSASDVSRQVFSSYATLYLYDAISSFSTPYGSYNDDTLRLVSYHYDYHVTAMAGDVQYGVNDPTTFDPLIINRLDTHGTSAWEMCDAIAAIDDDQMYSIIFHKIDSDTSGEYTISFNEFRQILSCIQAEGVATVTITQGAEEMLRRQRILGVKR